MGRGHHPLRRVLGWLAAFALALQVAAPNAAAARLATCCCKHKEEAHKCRCPVCEHQRQIASNLPCMKTCGGSQEMAAPLANLAFEPPIAALEAPLPLPDPVARPVPSRPDSPVIEVETPPPLA
jgi:DNA-binding helix-hairpin-helix protein with protein kinase domain